MTFYPAWVTPIHMRYTPGMSRNGAKSSRTSAIIWSIVLIGFFTALGIFLGSTALHQFNLTHFQGETTGVAVGTYREVPDYSKGSGGSAYALEYTYMVDGKEYSMTGRLHYQRESAAAEAADKYEGIEITVYYMLDDPYETSTDGEKDAIF